MVSAPPGIALDVGAEPFVPERKTLPALREAVQGCRGCDLYRNATQAVFGEGARRAEVMLRRRAARRPGGPRRASRSSAPPGSCSTGRSRRPASTATQTYVTNAVKHFKWQAPRKAADPPEAELVGGRPPAGPGSRPSSTSSEPSVLVCLGATAAQSLLGRDFRVTQHRGELLDSDLAEHVTATIHPSAILRQRDEESRHAEFAAFVDDLRVVARAARALRLRDGQREGAGALHPLDLKLKRPLAAELERDRLRARRTGRGGELAPGREIDGPKREARSPRATGASR